MASKSEWVAVDDLHLHFRVFSAESKRVEW
jgi:hypothetical protein